MSNYVISDIHGQYELFMKMLETINFTKEDKMYILGDMVDRGKGSLEVVEHIMASENMFPILGNHEDMLLYAIQSYGLTGAMAKSMIQGTDSYETYMKLRRIQYKSPARAREIINYLKFLPLYHSVIIEDRPYLLVHAGIRDADIEKNEREDLLWIREEFYNSKESFPVTVIFGHTPTAYLGERGRMWINDDRIGIDCGAGFLGGRLGCLRLEDMKEFYV